jgi:hypothetical protein
MTASTKNATHDLLRQAGAALTKRGWIVQLGLEQNLDSARLRIRKMPVPLSAPERREFAISRGQLDSGQAIIAAHVAGDPTPVLAELEAVGLQAQATGIPGDPVLIFVGANGKPHATQAPAEPPPPPEGAGLLHLITATTGDVIAARRPLRLDFARDVPGGHQWFEGVIDIDELFGLVYARLVLREERDRQPRPQAPVDVSIPIAEEAQPKRRGRKKAEAPAQAETQPEPEPTEEIAEVPAPAAEEGTAQSSGSEQPTKKTRRSKPSAADSVPAPKETPAESPAPEGEPSHNSQQGGKRSRRAVASIPESAPPDGPKSSPPGRATEAPGCLCGRPRPPHRIAADRSLEARSEGRPGRKPGFTPP